MSKGIEFNEWKKETRGNKKKHEFAMRQLELLKSHTLIDGNHHLASQVTEVCGLAQVQLTAKVYEDSLAFLNLKFHGNQGRRIVREMASKVYLYATNLRKLEKYIGKSEKVDPSILPEAIKHIKENWKVNRILLGAAEMLSIYADQLAKKAQLKAKKNLAA
jgi:hypothetical protein